MTPAEEFERELEIFRTEAEQAIQFLYVYLAIHDTAGGSQSVHDMLNDAALFWNTSLGALQTAAFIALGRVFDQHSKSKHNVDRLLGLAQKNPGIFSKVALSARKAGLSPADLANYLQDVYVPTAKDFRHLRAMVGKHRKIYEAKYRDIRHKWFAHKEISDSAEIGALMAKTNIRELQRLVTFLGSLYEALWELFFNGRKPVVRQRRYSIRAMRKRPTPPRRMTKVQERVTQAAAKYLKHAASLMAAEIRTRK
jgi:hypothetical protein